MIISLLAIGSIMALGWLFGIVCDRLLIRWSQGHSEAIEDGSEDHDRWEADPVPTMPCRGCIHEKTSMFDEPCLTCVQSAGWERIDDTDK